MPESRYLAVELTSRCNRRCLYCYNPARSPKAPPRPEVATGEIISLLDRVLTRSGYNAVQLTGGEPLLHPGLFPIIEYLRSRGKKVSLVTDGGLITPEVAARLKQLGVGPVQPTLLAANRDLHNHLKAADGFDGTIAGITHLRRARVPVSVAFVCTAKNFNHFKGVVELCLALGVRTIAFNRFCSSGLGRENARALMPDPGMITSCLEVAELANTRLGMKVQVAVSLPHCLAAPDLIPHLNLGRCALSTENPGYTMDAEGNLRACSISPTILGNLRTEDWDTVIQRSRQTYFEQMTRLPLRCNSCESLERCGGGCREAAVTESGVGEMDPLVG